METLYIRPRRKTRSFLSRLPALAAAILISAGGLTLAQTPGYEHLGRQSDGSFLVSSTQRIEPGSIAFGGRPVDIALHPSGSFAAVLDMHRVLLLSPRGLLRNSNVWLRHTAGFRGATWTPDGQRLFVSTSGGYIQQLHWHGFQMSLGRRIDVKPTGAPGNPRPGGMAITRDGTRLFVAAINRNAVAEIDLNKEQWVRELPVQNLPFEVRLTEDEKTLIVSNWGGRTPTEEDERSATGNATIVVDPRGAAATGTLSLIPRAGGITRNVIVGRHPTAIAVHGTHAYVTNSASDSISDVNLITGRTIRTIPLRWGRMNLFGSMPCAIAVKDNTAYVCNGGDNAICVIDLISGKVRGFYPAGYYPVALALDRTGGRAYVLNSKGNGSVRRTASNIPGNAHDFQGTVSIVDLNFDLATATARVAIDNGWRRSREMLRPRLAVYNGAIDHVLYIIKENRSYDEILGDIKTGNGDPRLCFLGEQITPNQHALARQFTLFDNAYVSGTNSADGHQWCTQALANDYIERFYTGYRTYPFDGTCAMAISESGCLWDAALKRGRSIRDYGEYCDQRLAQFAPKPKNWLELWKDRTSGRNAVHIQAGTRIATLRPFINSHVLCWPLLQSDQSRADYFIRDYTRRSLADQVPNLMILSLPCDHTEGGNPTFPRPGCMVADNDLALGRIVEAVSRSPQWKSTCIFVIEDDAQFGLDHVDGHRTVCFALSPYTRRTFVDHELCNTVSVIRSIELMLGIEPMNRFDALTPPLRDCFSDIATLTPYIAVPNRIALDTLNVPVSRLNGKERYWTERSMALDWSAADRAEPRILNQVMWHSVCGVNSPYPQP